MRGHYRTAALWIGLSTIGLADAQEVPALAWEPSFAGAVGRARGSGKPLMIAFVTEGCGWCRKLESVTFADPEVIRQAAALVPLRLDAASKKDGEALARKYRVDAFPTVLLLDPAAFGDDPKAPRPGEVLGRIVGDHGPAAFAEELAAILRDRDAFPALLDRLARDPEDLDALGRIALIYALRRKEPAQAADALRRGEAIDPENTRDLLTPAFLAIGASLLDADRPDEAAAHFDKAARTSSATALRARALLGLATCRLAAGRADAAVREAEAALALEGLSDAARSEAEALLVVARAAARRRAGP